MLLGSLAAWIVFNVPVGFIRPPATSCLVYNTSGFFIETPKTLLYGYNTVRTVNKRSITSSDLSEAYENQDYDDIISWTQGPWGLTTSRLDRSGELDDLDYGEVPWNQLLAMEVGFFKRLDQSS